MQTPVPPPLAPPELVPLFAGLDLGPGTYYLVLATSALSSINIIDWIGDLSPQHATFTNAPGFSHGPGYVYSDDVDFAFHPSARFIRDDDNAALFWDLTTPEEVPEPGTIGLVAGGVALMAVRRKNLGAAFGLWDGGRRNEAPFPTRLTGKT